MFKAARLLLPSLLLLAGSTASAQTLLFEVRAPLNEGGQGYTFGVYGDQEEGSYAAYGIDVVAPDGQHQMLDQFESILPANSEGDALVVEDVNFDGYADLRIMEYLPGGSANIPFFYWLYQPASGTFVAADAFAAVLSPEVDETNRQLLSRQKARSNEYLTEFYDPQGEVPVLVRKEVRTYAPDGSSKLHVFVIKEDAVPRLVETRQLGPEE